MSKADFVPRTQAFLGRIFFNGYLERTLATYAENFLIRIFVVLLFAGVLYSQNYPWETFTIVPIVMDVYLADSYSQRRLSPAYFLWPKKSEEDSMGRKLFVLCTNGLFFGFLLYVMLSNSGVS